MVWHGYVLIPPLLPTMDRLLHGDSESLLSFIGEVSGASLTVLGLIMLNFGVWIVKSTVHKMVKKVRGLYCYIYIYIYIVYIYI